MFFNADGTIKKVIPTPRGVGVTLTSNDIQFDRFSRKSETGSSIAFLDSTNTFKGWCAILSNPGAWIQYNSVDFGSKKYKKAEVKAWSENGGTIQIHQDNANGPVIAEITVPKGNFWKTTDVKVSNVKSGVHNLFVGLKKGQQVELDWIRFLDQN